MEGFVEIMTLEGTAKYLKIGKSTLYKMPMKGKIPAVKIELGKDKKIIIRVPYDQELINKIETIPGRRWNPKGKLLQSEGGRNMTSPRVMYIRNTADIIPKLEHIRNADIKELAEIPHAAFNTKRKKEVEIWQRN